MKKLLIVGDNEFAEIASVYFKKDYGYDTEAFFVEDEYRKRSCLLNRPIYAYEEMFERYSPNEYLVFCSPVYTQLNRLRERFYFECKGRGFEMATYISPHAFVWENVTVGDNSFIFENNVVQYNAKIGNNVIIWSGNHIGHSANISDNCFISSQTVISGYTTIGKNSFLGVNATLGNNIELPQDTILGAGAVLTKSVSEPGGIFVGNPAVRISKSAYEYFGVDN